MTSQWRPMTAARAMATSPASSPRPARTWSYTNDAIGFFNVLSTVKCVVIRRVTASLRTRRVRLVISVSFVSLYLFVFEDRVANCALYCASVLNFVCDIGTVLIIRSRNTHHVYVRVFHLIPRFFSQVGFHRFFYKLVYFISLFEMSANGERVTSCEPDWLVEPLMHCSLT